MSGKASLKRGLKDIFGDPESGVVKRCFVFARVPLAAIAACVFGWICIRLYNLPDHAEAVDSCTRLLFAFWTIAVPCYFFLETVYGIKTDLSDKQKAKLDQFKASQDAARAVWAGCAAAIAVLILKPGS
jgi:hypothetical protein